MVVLITVHVFLCIKVLLPTGTIITIQTSVRGFINIWIKPSSVDRNKVSGTKVSSILKRFFLCVLPAIEFWLIVMVFLFGLSAIEG